MILWLFAFTMWVSGLNLVEWLRDYPNLRDYSIGKLLVLLLAWPISYPVMVFSR